jgi:diguanylate cyclase (GGDEF)-like protein
VNESIRPTSPRPDPQDQRIRRSWWLLSGSFLLLALLVAVRLWAGGAQPTDLALLGLVIVVGVAALRHRDAVRSLEAGRRTEAESFARIMRGLSRSISPDAIVQAIVEELTVGTAADHVVVVRRRPAARVLEATLVSSRPGVPSSTTLLPIGDLEDPVDEADPGSDRPAREPIAIPIDAGVAETARPAIAAGPARFADAAMGAAITVATRAATAVRDLAERAGTIDRQREALSGGPAATTPGMGQLVADRIATRVRDAYGLKHTLAAPLATVDGLVGAIVLSRRTADPWPGSARRILAGAAEEASAALTRAYSMIEAETRAATDALTGLPNRRYFDEFCGLIARRRRSEDAVGVLMIDIDKFKVLNDTYGHAVGDEVLRAVGGAIVSAVREDDVPARYGGEEFAVLLRNPSPTIALEVGERVRSAVRTLDLRRLGVPGVTVSVGAAVARFADQPVTDLVVEADKALYEAKRKGRDRVVAAA